MWETKGVGGWGLSVKPIVHQETSPLNVVKPKLETASFSELQINLVAFVLQKIVHPNYFYFIVMPTGIIQKMPPYPG